jgi:hypothetical protein
VIDLESKVFSVIYKTYKTSATEDGIALEHTSKHLLELSKNLSTSLNCGQGQPSTASAGFELQVLASECVKIAEKLQDELNYLKSKGGRRERVCGKAGMLLRTRATSKSWRRVCTTRKPF